MSCQTLAECEVKTYLNTDMLEPEALPVVGGTAAVISVRRPETLGANQDAAAVIYAGDQGAVLAVADGCGGMASGEEAARIAIQSLSDHITNAANDGLPLRGAILDGLDEANRQILDLKTGAGATIALVHLEGNDARPYHIGDSQIVVVGGRGKLKTLTTSHSPVGYAVESGLLEEDVAIDHDQRHLVSNFLGYDAMHVEVGSSRVLAAHDALLVASDGVMDNLLLEEIVELARCGRAPTVAAKMASLALQRMAAAEDGKPHKPDDLTLIVYSRRGSATL